MPTTFRYDRYFPKPGASTTNDITQVLSVTGTVSTILNGGKTIVLTKNRNVE